MTWQIPGAVMTGGVFGAGAVGGSVAGTNTGIITASTPFTIAQEWNNVAVLFTGFQINITDDASNAGSLLADFKVGANDVFSVSKSGIVNIPTGNYPYSDVGGSYRAAGNKLIEKTGNSTTIWNAIGGGNPFIALINSTVLVGSTILLGWGSTADPLAGQDTGFARKAAKIIEINSGTTGVYPGTALSTGVQTVAQLPAAATAGAGARSMVSDANSVVFNAAAVGGGANIMPVFCNGVGWFIG